MLSNVEEIGKRIKKKREEQGYKQQGFAEKIKIDKSSLNRYENGKQTPNLETLVTITNGLNVSLDYIVFGNNSDGTKKVITKKPYGYDVLKSFIYLIESGLIVIVENQYTKGLVINLRKNKDLLNFFDEVVNICKCKTRINRNSFDEGIEKIVNDYLPKLFDDEQKNNPLYERTSYTVIYDDDEFDENFDEVIRENKNDVFSY